MRVGINLPYRDGRGEPLDTMGIMSRARMIEDAGFDAIWQPDTLVPDVQPRPDPLTWLTIACAATSRIELGTAIYIVPYRNPVELAQRLLTMHLVSGGRFTIGVGAGSTRTAHEAAGVDFDDRFRMLHSHVRTIRALCRGEQVGKATLNPWPKALGGPKFMLGAWHSETSLRQAVNNYDGWICSGGRTSLNVISEGLKRYRDKGGRRAMVATCPIDLSAPTEKLDQDGGFHLRCGPEEALERLHKLVDLGFDDVGLVMADHTKGARRYEVDFTAQQLTEIAALARQVK